MLPCAAWRSPHFTIRCGAWSRRRAASTASARWSRHRPAAPLLGPSGGLTRAAFSAGLVQSSRSSAASRRTTIPARCARAAPAAAEIQRHAAERRVRPRDVPGFWMGDEPAANACTASASRGAAARCVRRRTADGSARSYLVGDRRHQPSAAAASPRMRPHDFGLASALQLFGPRPAGCPSNAAWLSGAPRILRAGFTAANSGCADGKRRRPSPPSAVPPWSAGCHGNRRSAHRPSSQLHAAAVFLVAIGAGGRQRLIRSVRQRVMAGGGGVAGVRAEQRRGARPRRAGSAGPLWHASHFFAQGVRARHRAGAIRGALPRRPADTQSTAAIGNASDSGSTTAACRATA